MLTVDSSADLKIVEGAEDVIEALDEDLRCRMPPLYILQERQQM